MLSYEEFYVELQPVLKALKDSAGAAGRYQKAIQKNVESGNLAEVRKSLDQLAAVVDTLKENLSEADRQLEKFDTNEYFASGDFSSQLLASCEEKEIDVRGEKGVYEMFPYKVRVTADGEHAEVYINRKKMPSFRPGFVAESIRAGREKLYKAAFNDEAFMAELAEAYETSCLKSDARIGSTQKLEKVYKAMVPMARAKKEYDKQAFAFDLARLYEKGAEKWVTKSGKRYYFGTSRDGKSGYRVLSSTGVESYINTIKPLNEE